MGLPSFEDQAILAKLAVFDAKNRVFWRLLEKHLSDERARLKKKSEITILDIGCGVCEEARTLSAFFGGNAFDVPSGRVKIVGVDNDPALIAQAEVLCQFPSPMEGSSDVVVVPKCTFVAGDATRLDTVKEAPAAADIVVLRHQFLASDLLNKNSVWATIVSQALARVAPDGKMILTSYREVENELLLKILAVYPCEVLGNFKNKWALSQQMPNMPESHFDKFLTIVKPAAKPAKTP